MNTKSIFMAFFLMSTFTALTLSGADCEKLRVAKDAACAQAVESRAKCTHAQFLVDDEIATYELANSKHCHSNVDKGIKKLVIANFQSSIKKYEKDKDVSCEKAYKDDVAVLLARQAFEQCQAKK